MRGMSIEVEYPFTHEGESSHRPTHETVDRQTRDHETDRDDGVARRHAAGDQGRGADRAPAAAADGIEEAGDAATADFWERENGEAGQFGGGYGGYHNLAEHIISLLVDNVIEA
jgi:hypothetical protein